MSEFLMKNTEYRPRIFFDCPEDVYFRAQKLFEDTGDRGKILLKFLILLMDEIEKYKDPYRWRLAATIVNSDGSLLDMFRELLELSNDTDKLIEPPAAE